MAMRTTPPSSTTPMAKRTTPPSSTTPMAMRTTPPSSTTPMAMRTTPPSSTTPMNMRTTPPSSTTPMAKRTTPPSSTTPMAMRTTPPSSTTPMAMRTTPPSSTTPTAMRTTPPSSTTPMAMRTTPPSSTTPMAMRTTPPSSTTPMNMRITPPSSTTPLAMTTTPPSSTIPTAMRTTPPPPTTPTDMTITPIQYLIILMHKLGIIFYLFYCLIGSSSHSATWRRTRDVFSRTVAERDVEADWEFLKKKVLINSNDAMASPSTEMNSPWYSLRSAMVSLTCFLASNACPGVTYRSLSSNVYPGDTYPLSVKQCLPWCHLSAFCPWTSTLASITHFLSRNVGLVSHTLFLSYNVCPGVTYPLSVPQRLPWRQLPTFCPATSAWCHIPFFCPTTSALVSLTHFLSRNVYPGVNYPLSVPQRRPGVTYPFSVLQRLPWCHLPTFCPATSTLASITHFLSRNVGLVSHTLFLSYNVCPGVTYPLSVLQRLPWCHLPTFCPATSTLVSLTHFLSRNVGLVSHTLFLSYNVCPGGYQCFCEPGFHGNQCQHEINECDPNPCQNNAKCIDGRNRYTCDCPIGVNCEIKVTTGCSSSPCLNGGTCIAMETSGQYTCTCSLGYKGQHCEVNIDDCVNHTCMDYQVCTDLVNNYRCDCPVNTEGNLCEINLDLCASGPCFNSATCVHEGDRYTCECPEGYSGVNCEVQNSLCFPNPCFHGASCDVTFNPDTGYRCTCAEGFIGTHCEAKVTQCHSIPCLHDGVCVENLYTSGYTCACKENYTGNICETELEGCLRTGCLNEGTCVATDQGHMCQCLSAWEGVRCEDDVDECNTTPCQNGGQCVNLAGMYICLCTKHWTGTTCTEDELECVQSPCKNGATCVETVGGEPACLCPLGQKCEDEINECEVFSPCVNNATCTDLLNAYKCSCIAGFTGENCEDEVNSCSLDPCRNNATCVSEAGRFQCTCLPGWEGDLCEVNIDDCSPDPCYNGSPCLDGVDDYTCKCATGYEGKNCSKDIQECLSAPCLHGGTCSEPVANGYKCTCPAGVYGDTCQFVSVATFDGSSLVSLNPLTTNENVGNSTTNENREKRLAKRAVYDRIKRQATEEINIKLTFTTTILEGTLILATGISAAQDNSHFLVQFVEGNLIVSQNLNGELLRGQIPLAQSGFDSVSHVVTITMTTTETNISLGNCSAGDCHLALKSSVIGQKIILNESLYIGGLPQMTAYLRSKVQTLPGFTGCIGNLSINNEPISILPASHDANQTDQSKQPIPGCRSHDLCVQATCQNGGQCMDKWFSQYCQCADGYTVSNDVSGVAGTAQGTVGNYLDVDMPLFLGQVHEHPSLSKWKDRQGFKLNNSFTGCIKNLTINQSPVDLMTSSESIFGNDPPAAIPGCARDTSCSGLPCQHGGRCNGNWGTHSCQCSSSYSGKNCEQAQSATFNGRTSFMEFHLNTTAFAFGDEGSFEFRTRNQTVTLMYLQFYHSLTGSANGSLEFSLYKGALQMTLTLESGKPKRLTFNQSLSDGQWHTVIWSRGHGLLKVTQGSKSLSLVTQFNPFSYQSKITAYLAGKPFQRGNPGFLIGLVKGCIRNVTFNENIVPFLDPDVSKNSGVNINSRDILHGCHGDDICNLDPCEGHSKCTDVWNAKECSCLEGWEGIVCNVSSDDCVQNLCANGLCVDEHLNYTCACDIGYTGDFCDSIYDPCDNIPCSTEGSINCTFTFPAKFECLCKSGWTGEHCSTEINECERNPCLHAGKCSDLVDGYNCDCTGDYFGDSCEQVYICSSQPCFNGGTCNSSDDNLNFTCECIDRFSGKNCETFDICFNHICRNNATCISSSEGYTCQCFDGFYGVYCEFPDLCSSNPCLNNATCNNDKNTFNCVCNEHYSGLTCESLINYCDKNPCKNGGQCFFTEETVTYDCRCLLGFEGEHCEIDANECLSNPCLNGATCIESNQTPWNFFPGYHCTCALGFYGNQCENETNECDSLPCKNNGNCEDLVNSYQCKCLDKFSGANCEIDLRGCSSNPCQNNAQCVQNEAADLTIRYSCVCVNGFVGAHCESNVNDCVNHKCVNGATCVDGIDSYTCNCQQGYDGIFCHDVADACYSQPCRHGGVCNYRGLCDCVEIVNTCGWHNETCQTLLCNQTPACNVYTTPYTCNCDITGYHGDICDVDVNECVNTNACEHDGVCVNTQGNYTCDCTQTGFKGQCENFAGSFKCLCQAGWTGQTCGQLVDNCMKSPCKHGGICVNTLSGFICDCLGTGYQGNTCELNINDCFGNPCQNNGRCVDGVNSFTCDCAVTGYHGDRCQVETDDCAGVPCANNATCRDVGLTFECLCTDGFTDIAQTNCHRYVFLKHC
ncbi:LOW QUALITY PROTEIN: FBP1-like protein [Mya arenaria]|uniref:FBP1-like protein n=1 Tax=Mya arenaria TaxID=6604 RepID=A0ABY7G891_MYAAR|nr:LOW QUALITY PROTEIN: FBP1-like protein [Mya arenaria]